MEKISRILKAITFIAIGTITLLINPVIAKAEWNDSFSKKFALNSKTSITVNFKRQGNKYIIKSFSPKDTDVYTFDVSNYISPTCDSSGSITIDQYQYYFDLGNTKVSSKEFSITALGHDYVETITKEPTYKEDGIKTFTCSVCGDTYTEAIQNLVCTEHIWDSGTVTKEPTYHESGIKIYTCINCGEIKTEVIPKLVCTEHAWDSGVTIKEPTYHETGIKKYTCINCGETKTEIIPVLTCPGHEYDQGMVIKEATTDEEGIKRYTCTICGDTYDEVIPKVIQNPSGYTGSEAVTDSVHNGFDSIIATIGEVLTIMIPSILLIIILTGAVVYFYRKIKNSINGS